MDKKKMKEEVISYIVSFLVDKTGNNIFDSFRERLRIKNLLKKDGQNIERIFYAEKNTDLYNLVEEFIFYTAFKEPFFYSPMNLTESQEEIVWLQFTEYMREQTNNKYIDGDYREKIIRCINLHNEAVNRMIMDESTRFQAKTHQIHYNSINMNLKEIIDTLNTQTSLQIDDEELNFSIEELESIIKSYRFDINNLRRIQSFIICGSIMVLFIMTIFIPISIRYVENILATIVMVYLLCMVMIILLFLWRDVSRKVIALEGKLEMMRDSLWDIHFELYKNQIKVKYTKGKHK